MGFVCRFLDSFHSLPAPQDMRTATQPGGYGVHPADPRRPSSSPLDDTRQAVVKTDPTYWSTRPAAPLVTDSRDRRSGYTGVPLTARDLAYGEHPAPVRETTIQDRSTAPSSDAGSI